MNRYVQSLIPKSAWVYTCTDCGAAVIHTATHDDWHARWQALVDAVWVESGAHPNPR